MHSTDKVRQEIEKKLRRGITAFLSRASGTSGSEKRRRNLRNVLQLFQGHDRDMFLFGGVPRDLLMHSVPRDIDLVVSAEAMREVTNKVCQVEHKWNRFGGLNFKSEGWDFDVWPVEKTWAFSFEPEAFSPDFSSLPKTTFLNVEAIAVQLWPVNGKRTIYENGFFEAFKNQILEINYEPNPAPAYCIFRSLLIAQKLKFSIGHKLVRYITSHSNDISLHELIKLQSGHYGKNSFIASHFARWLDLAKEHTDKDKKAPLQLPIVDLKQLPLFDGHQLKIW